MPTQTNREETVSPSVPTVAPKRFELTAATAVLPLRLFLGLTFVAASIDKFTDPQFFNASATGYIGNQLAGFARNSPIGDFLTAVAVPNAMLFGLSVAIGQIAIGLGTLVGLFSRTAALFGTILSFTLWLSASWAVEPFYFGSDLPYMLGWLTLLVAGAHPVFSLDGQIQQWREKRQTDQPFILQPEPQIAGMARRHFLTVAGATFVAGTATAVAWGNTLAGKDATTSTATPAPTVVPATGSSTGATTPNGTIIATTASLAMGEAQVFNTPDNKQAILIHGDDDVFRAFSTLCTHQGCGVGYSKADKALVCPCHGARFDIKTGAPTRPPATSALKSYSVQVANGNVVFVQQ